MQDLKILGAGNATAARPRGLTGRARLAALDAAYEIHRRDGRLPASYEVVYGHAWVPEQKPAAGGIAVPVSAIGRRYRATSPVGSRRRDRWLTPPKTASRARC
jgi:malonyl-CoA O-methyltransferase